MPTPLDALLESIHPSKTGEVILERMDEALNHFRLSNNCVTNAIEYRSILCRFVEHLDHSLGIVPKRTAYTEGMLWHRATGLLRQAYGPHGDVAAYETQRSGAEGGLHHVLRRLAAAVAEEKTRAEVTGRIERFCQRLSANEYMAVGEEYMRKHGHLLPAEIREGSSIRVRLNLAGLLKQHYELLVSTSRVGRR